MMICDYYKGKVSFVESLEFDVGTLQFLWYRAIKESEERKREEAEQRMKEEREERIRELRAKNKLKSDPQNTVKAIKTYKSASSILKK